MANRPGATSAGVAASERDALLATKPHVQPGFVPRPRLVDLLENALAGELVLVCAPAGFGEAALLGDWARRGGRAGLRGCRWMPVTATRRGSGGRLSRRWTGRGRGPLSGRGRCSGRRLRPRLRGW